LVCKEKYGFLSQRSTVSNLVSCDAKIASYLNDHLPCDVIMLDFVRAFDQVSHSVLLAKLCQLGLCEQPRKWIADFLRGRRQRVVYKGATSMEANVTSGVIQGSVLGPTLFTGFINDLPDNMRACDTWLFADDAKVASKAADATDCDVIQRDMDAFGDWSERSHLPININKCASLHYGHSNPCHTYSITGASIKNVDQCPDLGVLRTSDFRYNAHIDAICLKASRLCGMVLKLFASRDRKFLVRIYLTYIRPCLEYASAVWSPSSVGLSNQLERVQRRFTRRLFGRHPLDYEDRLSATKITSLSARRKAADLIQAFKVRNHLIDIDPGSIGIVQTNSTTRGNMVNMARHGASSQRVACCYNFRIQRMWNSLPLDVKSATSLDTFKNKLWGYLGRSTV